MNSVINELVRSVVRKNALSECTVNELEKLVAQYPYFGPAQFLLAQKLKEENSPLYEQQYQKAILYFKDHLWFDYLSRNEDSSGTIHAGASTSSALTASTSSASTGSALTNDNQDSTNSAVTNDIQEVSNGSDLTNDIQEKALEGSTNEFVVDHNTESSANSAATNITEVKVLEEPIQEETQDNETTGTEHMQAEPIEAPKLPQLKIEPLNAKAAALTFEPYHTIDYFASQGIRVKEEEKPKDRFSQQLKSFTEWLKVIKKAPESEMAAKPTAPEDPKVTRMAEHSLADRDVVTEAMADVWEQQGNKEKAIETYNKLSLLNPSKSAYFAAKIEHLKHP